MTLQLDERTWNRGYAAGRTGEPCEYPVDVEDRLAWLSGYVEGRAAYIEERQQALSLPEDGAAGQ